VASGPYNILLKLTAIRGVPDAYARVYTEIHSEAVIEQVWTCNYGLRLSELRESLRGRDRTSVEMYFEAVIEGAS